MTKNEKDFRIERDTLGEVRLPKDKLFGAQTERSRTNFLVGSQKMPQPVIYAIAYIKKAAALVNCKLGILSREKCDAIIAGAEAILSGKLDDQFPLVVWQTGSGTQSNMNVNEVISNYASREAGMSLGSHSPLHPNDDVNKSQSSNDVFPSAMHIATILQITRHLLPNLSLLLSGLEQKSQEFHDIIKVGRTHLMDATPMSLGQEFSGYATQIRNSIQTISQSLDKVREIALGGTAVGTGINAPKEYATLVAQELSILIGEKVISAPNKFEALACSDSILEMSGSLKRLAASLMKIAGDIALLSSGPRCGIGEIILPINEPGSSIMPGKVNPTQCESMAMVACQVIGNDAAITMACSKGRLELNVFRPVMIYNLLDSITLLGDSVSNFYYKCVEGIQPNRAAIEHHLDNSLMTVTALTPTIGYEKAATIVKEAFDENISIAEAGEKLGILSREECKKLMDFRKLANLDNSR